MRIQAAEFVTSAARAGDLPHDPAPHIALVGRSNVGKSSLINALTRRRVARTSAAPGKTRLINLYRVVLDGGPGGNRRLFLVDLPGYGYARGGDQAMREFKALTAEYFGLPGVGPDDRGPGPSAARQRATAPARRVAASARASADDAGPARRPGAPREPKTSRGPDAVVLLVDARHPGLGKDLAAHAWLAATGLPYGVVATKCDRLTRAELRSAPRTFANLMNVPVLPVSAETGEGLDDLWKLILRLCNAPAADPTPPLSSSPR